MGDKETEMKDDILKQMKDWEDAHRERQRKFWEEVYPSMTLEEKVIYWRKDVFQAMQFQEESGKNPYDAFSSDWLDYHLSIEPDFMKILEAVVQKLSLKADLVNSRIKTT